MKYFSDTVTSEQWAFEDHVEARVVNGHYEFYVMLEEDKEFRLKTPSTLVPSAGPKIDHVLEAQTNKLAYLNNEYSKAIQQPINFLGTYFQADIESQNTLNKVLTGSGGTLPGDFYWLDISNNKVQMNIEKLQILSSLMLNQGWTAFQNLQDKKTIVKTVLTIEAINGVIW